MKCLGHARANAPLAVAAAIVSGLLVSSALAASAIETLDDSGARVRLEAPARRIVTLSPHLTELVFEAGAGDRIVGAAAYSDFPEAARAIPRIGDARALDLERIVALRPDLIVAWSSGSPRRQVERLRKLGYPLFGNEPERLDDIASAIERLGLLAGTSQVADERAHRFRQRLAKLRADNAQVVPVRVFYQVWGRPLLTVSANHVIDDALRSCKAENLFADRVTRLPRPTRESVLLADPDAIIAADASEQHVSLAAWRRWPRLRAVALGNLYTVDPNLLHRHTPRILDGVASLCSHVRSVRRHR